MLTSGARCHWSKTAPSRFWSAQSTEMIRRSGSGGAGRVAVRLFAAGKKFKKRRQAVGVDDPDLPGPRPGERARGRGSSRRRRHRGGRGRSRESDRAGRRVFWKDAKESGGSIEIGEPQQIEEMSGRVYLLNLRRVGAKWNFAGAGDVPKCNLGTRAWERGENS